MQKKSRLLIFAALISGGIVFTAPPAQAHCDDPHGVVEEAACWAQSFPGCALGVGPGVIPSPGNILYYCSPEIDIRG